MVRRSAYLCEFGHFRLDATERLLSRDGEVVPLAPKAFDLLLAMVERHGVSFLQPSIDATEIKLLCADFLRG